MGTVEFQGLNQEFTTNRLSESGTQQAAPALERSALLSRVSWRFETAERQGRYARLGDLVLETLDRRMGALEDAVARFSWPVSGTPGGGAVHGARLVTPANTDADVKGLLRAELHAGDDVQRYYKYFSRGRSAATDSDLDGRDYAFTITQGGVTESIAVSVPEGDDWGQVLERTAASINASSLPVQAEVVRQTAPYQRLNFLPKSGAILAVTVNAAYQAQDVAFRDTDGLLTTKLDLTPTSAPVGAPALRRHNVRQATPASASTFVSTMVNPVAAPPLTAGEHRLLLGVGGVDVAVPVSVDADMDWEALLKHIANRINSADLRVAARVVDGEMPTGRLTPAVQRAMALELTLAAPKRGERLSMSEYGGPWLDDVNGFHDPTTGLPNWVTGGERYIAGATANGWTKNNIYEYDGTSWAESTTKAANAVRGSDDGQDWFFDGSTWSATPSGTLVHTLGLNLTSAPGADASARIDGRTVASETGVFTLDRGRLTVDVQAPTGDNLPLRVVEGYAETRDRFMDVVTAYNGLREFLIPNADLFEAGFADSWTVPVAQWNTELEWLGVEELSGSKNLWIKADAFWSALVGAPDRAKTALHDAGGLIPRLGEVTAANRSPSLNAHLIQPRLLRDPGPPPRTEAALHKRSSLQEVVDAATDAPRPKQSPYVEFSNILTEIVQRKREELRQGIKTGATGKVFDSDI